MHPGFLMVLMVPLALIFNLTEIVVVQKGPPWAIALASALLAAGIGIGILAYYRFQKEG